MSRDRMGGRRSLVGWAPVAALAAAAAGGLVALFLEGRGPRPELSPAGRDAVATAYLRAEASARPDDAALRLRLAREELALGRWAEANQALAPLVEGSAPSREGLWLSLEIATAAWRADPAAAPERLLAAWRRVTGPEATAEELARAARAARDLGRFDLAAQAAERAAAVDPRGCARWLAEASRDFLAAADPRSAAASTERAWACAGGEEPARALGLAALRARVAADQGREALRLAQLLAARYPSDREILGEAERIAFAQNDPARARRFATRLYELGAADPDRLHRLLDLDLGAGDLDAAARVADRLVHGAPMDPATRLIAARTAEWAGRPLLAIGHQVWLARHRSDAGDVEEALRLARAIPDHAAIAEMLIHQSRDRALAPAALRELALALDRAGPPAAAVAALADHAARHPESRTAWEELAALQERRGDLAGALATRAEMGTRFGDSLESSLPVAKLSWALGRSARALAELARWADSAGPAQDEYWALLAELAWSQEADPLAARAYRVLWDRKRIGVAGAERLVLLAREAGRPDEAIRLGREGWVRFGEPRLLLLAMDEASRAGRWEELSRSAEMAARSPDAFARLPTYWMLLAQRDARSGRTAQAVEDYRRALEVDPGSPAARSGLLWLLVEAGDRDALDRWLSAWAADAGEEPALWGPYAASLELLGRREEALAFRAREAEADPDDSAARARYLAAMAAVGPLPRPAAALRAELSVQSMGPWVLRRAEARTSAWIGPAEVELRAAANDLASGLPAGSARRALELRAGATWEALGGRTEVSGGASVKPGHLAPLASAVHTRRLAPFAEVRVEAAANERALESAELLADGSRNRAGGALTLTAGSAYGRGALEWAWWRWDAGPALGHGGTGTVEIGWRVPVAEPEIALRLQGAYQRDWPIPGAPGASLLPPEAATLGLGASAARWRVGPATLLLDAWLGWAWHPGRPAYRLQASVAAPPFGAALVSLGAYAANDRWGAGAGDFGFTVSFSYELPRSSP